jgi:hydrogenase nickel incorporation protein HypA/HybF
MHELSLIEQILNIACQQAINNGFNKIEKISLQVGKLSGVMPEALELGFAISKEGTIAAESILYVQWLSDDSELTLISIEVAQLDYEQKTASSKD